ncbi:glycosyltransferase family 4 protein [Photobacterium toruni]|uniref:N, N'-diacetylbacillosaminyl-diphospho-undecaprenol alpha-1,3-N-acetylgalactosaminyltransferase n=1 Tax=Photobacterium toruni TaxID=1935446 RepID=A0A1T4N8L3_9GAMM|nr:glycosyltransferase family 4 protein [Photobacterium toruni]SJZ75574.1 N, N'-diacetylbacillosaminyl-diphospho-undecaprenol alpha-1,3-N-acetylgalactosaminyltransferase [Photobacterium toruni]
MKILFLVNCSGFFYSHFLRLALSLKEKGVDVCIAAGNNNKKDELENLGLKFVLLPLSRSGKNIAKEIKALYSINKEIMRFKPDIIHAFTIKPVLYGSFISKINPLIKSNVVTSITGLGSLSLSKNRKDAVLWGLIEKLYKFSLSTSRTKVIFENNDDMNFFIEKGISNERNSFVVNGAGVDLDIFNISHEKYDVTTIILVSRLLKDKGISEYIEAGKILKDEGVNVRLLLVGDIDNNNPSTMSEKEIKDAHKKGYIDWVGFQNDIAKYNKLSHIACLPSYREGRPKSLIEATACGLPIITTDVPGCRQMVDDGLNGIIVPVRNAVKLADAIKTLSSSPEMMDAMGNYSRLISEKIYGHNAIKEQFHNIYGIK